MAHSCHPPSAQVSRRSGCCPAMALSSWSGERSACDKTCIRVGVSCLRAVHTRYTKIGPVTLGRWRPKRSSLAPRNVHLNPCPGFNSEAGKGIQKSLCVGRRNHRGGSHKVPPSQIHSDNNPENQISSLMGKGIQLPVPLYQSTKWAEVLMSVNST